MSKGNQNLRRWLAVLAAAGIALVAILGWRRDKPAGRPEAAGTLTSQSTPQAGVPAPSANPSARDWSSWASGLSSFTAADFQSLVEEALAITDSDARTRILSEILAAWLKTDARSFNKYLMALEVRNESGKLDSLMAALKTALPQVADRIATSQTLQEVVRRFIARFARNDPAAALAWATTWLRGEPHDSAFVQILGPLAARDAALARAEVGNVTAPLRRMQSLAAVGGNWAKTDAAAAAGWATQIAAPTERAMAMNSVFLTLAHADPADAAGRLAGATHVMVNEYAVRYRNELAAMNLTELDAANNTEAYRELLNDGAVPPPNSPDVELLAEAARVIAGKLAETNPNAAASWATSLENEFLRLNAMKGVFGGWIQRDPEAAVNHYQATYGRYHDMLASIYDRWAGADPAAAAAGVVLLQDKTHQAIATQTVARAWATTDATGAARWLDRLPAAAQTDEARLAIVTGLAETQPVSAWNRALEIANSSAQYRGLKAAFGVLLATDPNQARTLLQAASLPPTATERLAEMMHAVE